MIVEIEDFKTGWFGIGIGLKSDEIDQLIELLKMIKADPEQHFHISSPDYTGDGGVGDIEIYIQNESQKDNVTFFGKALAPGDKT